ncbi:28s ribosomal protein s29 [Quercus suber]|uniref:Small ribosomal subunit protein mS29 n=1 Tax=Quercus suber TaxID=58331 RepID=A0AAW0LMN4_QUESU
MLRSILRAATATSSKPKPHSWTLQSSPIPTPPPPHHSFSSARNYSVKNATATKGKKGKFNKSGEDAGPAEVDAAVSEAQARARRLAMDEKDPTLDVGPNGLPLFTSTPSLSLLSRKDTCSYFKFSMESLKSALPEGLPTGMVKEFEDSLRPALLVRQSFLDLRPKLRKQVVLDGPVSCGKSIALAMLVHWARDEGWLVFYVPRGRDWTHGGFFYKNPNTDLWDTPLQAENVLKARSLTPFFISASCSDFLKWNESHLKQLPCQISDPIPLGEGAGVGQLKDVDNMAMPEGSTLYDLVNTGIKHTHAAVGVVVRLRKELSLVKNIPVLIAIDQYNSWFTFSEYEEAVKVHSRRPVHARELTMVNAFRSMMHDDMMVGAFSHSTAVGKLRKDLPDVPEDARVNCPRYTLDEAASVCHYYLRQRLVQHEVFSEENWKKVYYLANGNGSEMRGLVPFMRQST